MRGKSGMSSLSTADRRTARTVRVLAALAAVVWLATIAGGCGSVPVEIGPGEGPYVVVLGIAQDGGYPQAGCNRPHCDPGWRDAANRHAVSSIAVVDPLSSQRWLIDVTPDFPAQLRMLDGLEKPRAGAPSPSLDGIFVTHAHIGHYAGLIHLGREVIGASGVPLHVMPRMRVFIENNGPWSQLVELGNVQLVDMVAGSRIRLNERLAIESFLVPHRDEFSETVGFLIHGPERSVAYLPDIDKWERWGRRVEDLIADVDVAYLDGTFYANGEIARDMSEIPHPFIEETMARLRNLPATERSKVRFIHLNHTNPLLQDGSRARAEVERQGMGVAETGEITPL